MNKVVARVLVLDSDPVFAGGLRAMLVSRGFDVELVGGIAEAIERMKDTDVDCVVMDEGLPEMKGSDAVPVLKAIAPEVPVIVTAAKNSVELETRIRGTGIFFYHCKAFDMHDLVLAIQNAVRRHEE